MSDLTERVDTFMSESVSIRLLILITVPMVGELNFHPFPDDFRISFGTAAFSLCAGCGPLFWRVF